MEYRMPDYYNEFKCIAGECPCSCCSGWGIYIDDRTYEKYKDSDADVKEYILKHVDEEEQCFKVCEGRCSFLNHDNLCELIIRQGEDMLCDTCRRYPRHFEIYGDFIEAALSMSCPVVAKMIIDRKKLDKFKVRTSDKKMGNAKEVDKRLLNALITMRKSIFDIAMNREKSIDERMRQILILSEMAQKVIYKYEKMPVKVPIIADKLLQQLKDIMQLKPKPNKTGKAFANRYLMMHQYFDMLLGLEMINEAWPKLVKQVMETLYDGMSQDKYDKNAAEFSEQFSEMEYEFEHILVYFLYTYFLGGVYDANIMGMVKMSVLSTMFIREMSFAKWLSNGKKLSKDERIENAYLYSRQVEHSDDNLLSLEGILTAHPLCATDKLIDIL